jgi:hypothetical protein
LTVEPLALFLDLGGLPVEIHFAHVEVDLLRLLAHLLEDLLGAAQDRRIGDRSRRSRLHVFHGAVVLGLFIGQHGQDVLQSGARAPLRQVAVVQLAVLLLVHREFEDVHSGSFLSFLPLLLPHVTCFRQPRPSAQLPAFFLQPGGLRVL